MFFVFAYNQEDLDLNRISFINPMIFRTKFFAKRYAIKFDYSTIEQFQKK